MPGNPGRVVTLLRGEEKDIVWGLAYAVAKTEWEEYALRCFLCGWTHAHRAFRTSRKLDFREKGGYSRCNVDVITKGGDIISGVLVYVAEKSNEVCLSWVKMNVSPLNTPLGVSWPSTPPHAG